MSKSLNPHAAGHAPRPADDAAGPPRRNLLAAIAAVVVGVVVGTVPFLSGLLVLLDPILKRKADASSAGAEATARPMRRVATLDSIPTDGTPIQVPVIADLTDAWNREANQPVGAVYLRRAGNSVECFNAICPHAGCFIGYAADRKVFQCPCHTSAFQLDGERIMPSPSPRDMDALKVDQSKLKDGEVWVEFVNYYPGHAEREAKP